MVLRYNFDDVPTVRRFILSKKKYKYIQGPVGSGKSSGCVMHLFTYMCQQSPNTNGVRKTRYVIIRNTFPQLYDTTKVTIDEWLPPQIYTWKERKCQYEFKFQLDDGTFVESTWLLRALDNPEHVRNLLSLEVTGAWINEAREVREEIFKMLRSRIGRYPPSWEGGPDYSFIIMDSNPPDTEHWIYKTFEELPKKDPKMHELFEAFYQPSGRSPEAENIRNLPPGYYEELAVGQDEDFIKVYIDGEYGYVKEGKPVFPHYRDSVHLADEPILPKKGSPVIIGMDFGLTPAAVLTQLLPNGQFLVLDERYTLEYMDLSAFLEELLIPFLSQEKYLGFEFIVIGDPAGSVRSQTDSRTCFSVLKEHGFMKAYPAWTNSIYERIRVVNNYLTRMIGEEPAFKLSPTCTWLRQALNGKYNFKRLRVKGDVYDTVPAKNEWSHIADALQYAALGWRPSYSHKPRPSLIKRRENFAAFI